ncbi:MAG: membrane protein insertase YidC [Bryobacterales bacterium]|nr:membrane protein insertase YidC [Bryobacterales bacterium]
MANSSKDPAPSNKPSASKPGGQKELSMEMRLLLTFILMGAVLFLTPYLMKTTAPPPPAKKAEQAAARQTAPKESPKETPKETRQNPPPAVPSQPPPGQVAAERQDDAIVLETDLYRVQFSNRGAVVRSWVLKKYRDNAGKPVELVNPVGGTQLGFPFSVQLKGAQVSPGPDSVLYVATRSGDGLTISFEYSDGKLHAKKTFAFDKNRYRVQFSSEISDQGRAIPHLVAWRGGFGDFSVSNTLSTQHTTYFDTTDNKLIVNDVGKAKNGPLTVTGRFNFAGIEDTYFAAVVLPPAGSTLEVETLSDKLPFVAEQNKEEPHIGVALGGEGVNQALLFVGPKDIDVLRALDPKLEQMVDFGWFWFLAKPLFASLNYVNDKFIHNYGWAIVVVTVLINMLLMPLKISNIRSMKKMSELQPQIQAIQAKYSNMSMRDPRRQQQQQETMELYKKHGVNPLGGCVPMALQMPFFFAFYKVLMVAIELRGAHWLWVTDLSQPEHLAIRILPVATIATQFLMQRMTPSTTADPQQQRIMQFMPLMFIFIFYSVASGLVLYWLTGNLVGIAQQYFFNKTMGVGAPAAVAVAPPKKSGKK